jgi:Zn-finger nucleic acid-binding protein
MSAAVTCPECQERFESADEGATDTTRCPRCRHLFSRQGRDEFAEGIQTSPVAVASPVGTKQTPEPEEAPARHHGTPRSPFPLTPILILLIGVLFFLLVFSISFNVWLVMNGEHRLFGVNAAARAEQQAVQQRILAEQAAQQAQAQQQEAQRKEAVQRRELEQLQQQLNAVRQELEDARRRGPKGERPPDKQEAK